MGGAALVKLLLDTHIWIWSVAEPERCCRESGSREFGVLAN